MIYPEINEEKFLNTSDLTDSHSDQNIFLTIKDKQFFLHALRPSLETLLSVYKKDI